jgi:hypothetical protein
MARTLTILGLLAILVVIGMLWMVSRGMPRRGEYEP